MQTVPTPSKSARASPRVGTESGDASSVWAYDQPPAWSQQFMQENTESNKLVVSRMDEFSARFDRFSTRIENVETRVPDRNKKMEDMGGRMGGLERRFENLSPTGTLTVADTGAFVKKYVEVKRWRSLNENGERGANRQEIEKWVKRVAGCLDGGLKQLLLDATLILDFQTCASFKI